MNIFTSINRNLGKKACLLAGSLMMFTTITTRAQTIIVSTAAGYAGAGAADGSGGNALFSGPQGVAVDASGNIYVADSGNHTIRLITSAGVSSTLAGKAGVSGSADGSGTNALFNQPSGIGLDSSNNIYVSDYGNHTIRKITPLGNVTTLAGTAGVAGSTNGTGTNAQFFHPMGLALDGGNNLYVADYGNHLIRKLTANGVVSTLAGSAGLFGYVDSGNGATPLFYEPEAVTVDVSGNVYVADTGNGVIREVSAQGNVTTVAGFGGLLGSADATGTNALFYQPAGIAINSAGELLVADYFNNTIRKISPAGVVTTLAGATGTTGSADGAGTLARFWGPQGLAVNSAGTIYVADTGNGTVRMITLAGLVTTLAGSPSAGSVNGISTSARFYNPRNVAVDGANNIYVADTQNSVIRKITPLGAVSVLAGTVGVFGSADGPGVTALFSGPQGITVDNAGNIYVADTGNSAIRKVAASGVVSTLAGSAGNPGNADGSGVGAQFSGPQGIAVDGAGNVYVSDTLNYTIREITPAGVVTTLAGVSGTYGSVDGANSSALFGWPKGLALDSANNLYVADYLNHTIRQITPAGAVTTLAGLAGVWGSADGTNSNARFFEPEAVTVDSAGNVLVLDAGNQTIRKLTPVGTNWVVTTVAGQAGISGSSDGFTNTALFYNPAAITLNSAGTLVVADAGNNTIRLGGMLPTISNLAAQPRPASAIIVWTTGIPATSQVAYGLTTNYGALSTLNSSLTTNHAVLLTGLSPNQVYYFQAISQGGVGQTAAVGSFSTALITVILQSPQALYAGVWVNDSSAPDRYSSVYKYASVAPPAPAASATFRPAIPTPGQYDVSFWYSEGSNRSAVAPVTATFQGGSVSTNVNETVNGGRWQLLASNQSFAAGTNAYVRLGNSTPESNKVVIADAVEWVYTSGQDLPVNGNVPAWWANYYYGVNTINGAATAANGYSLLNDYILGIAPTDPNTLLNFSLHPLASGFQAVFSPWAGGRRYQLQSTTNLANPVWQTLTNLSATQNAGGQGVIVGTNTSSLPTYYRLSVQLLP